MTAALSEPPRLRRVTPDDPEYQQLVREEAAFWAGRTGLCELVEAGEESPWARHTNGRFTGDEGTRWYETIARRGTFRRGLFLGTSGLVQDTAILRSNPGLHATFYDISEGSLAKWKAELGEEFGARIGTQTADLNFVELPEKAFDLVVSSSTLHHIVNLEHLAAQINRTLTSEGLFFLQDCVAENDFRYSDAKKRIFEELYNRDVARQRDARPGLTWTNEDRTRFSPFCGIRSAETLGILDATLDRVELHTAGTISALMLHAKPAARRRRGLARVRSFAARRVPGLRDGAPASPQSPAFIAELLMFDDVLADAGMLVPFNAFGVYRKRS